MQQATFVYPLLHFQEISGFFLFLSLSLSLVSSKSMAPTT